MSDRRRLYLDTSAYLEVLLGDRRSPGLKKDAAGAELLSSVLLVLEARRNLVRLARQKLLDATQYSACLSQVDSDIDRFNLRDLTLDLCGAGPQPLVATPRSLDLVHLRTALWFHDEQPIDRFVTLDARQEQAAREMGLPV